MRARACVCVCVSSVCMTACVCIWLYACVHPRVFVCATLQAKFSAVRAGTLAAGRPSLRWQCSTTPNPPHACAYTVTLSHAHAHTHAQDITTKMDQQAADTKTQLTENENLRAKLGGLLAQYDAFSQLVCGWGMGVCGRLG